MKSCALIHPVEIQAISARWRALASRSVRNRPKADSPSQEVRYYELSIRQIAAILLFAAGFSEADREKVEARCTEKVGKHLRRLWTMVYDLIKVTHEDILANDYKTVLIEPGVPFSGDTMRINGRPPKGDQIVLCTSGLGLERVISTVTQYGRSPPSPCLNYSRNRRSTLCHSSGPYIVSSI